MTSLRPAQHSTRNVTVIEIFDGDRLLGAIYPSERGIRLVSKHLTPDGITVNPILPPVLEVDLT